MFQERNGLGSTYRYPWTGAVARTAKNLGKLAQNIAVTQPTRRASMKAAGAAKWIVRSTQPRRGLSERRRKDNPRQAPGIDIHGWSVHVPAPGSTARFVPWS
ncbi:predicted protein [Histoplasma capsulatum var. duboisii H88]|uniref:Predicted protein n=2 Tax=Ajellomyces capsulatus TaxID=5037 RepID=F0U6N9_AJEC8|nr:predicted protein [Histoplasma capsulatum H143]EGC40678.1 predicted protein [Histoplasma capsulatum var. duboisii H88]